MTYLRYVEHTMKLHKKISWWSAIPLINLEADSLCTKHPYINQLMSTNVDWLFIARNCQNNVIRWFVEHTRYIALKILLPVLWFQNFINNFHLGVHYNMPSHNAGHILRGVFIVLHWRIHMGNISCISVLIYTGTSFFCFIWSQYVITLINCERKSSIMCSTKQCRCKSFM